MTHTTVGSIMRANQAYALQVSRAEPLEWGVAYASTAFAELPQANQLREVLLEDENRLPQAFAEVEAYYAQRGLRCLRWVPAMDQPYEAIGQFLWERGWKRRDLAAWALARWPEAELTPDVRVLPGRPMRAALRSTYVDAAAEWPAEYEEQWAESGLERLDEASYEAFVALRGGEPVGRCALFQVGDIGRVIDLYVPVRFRRQGVATALLHHILAQAKRLVMRTICLESDASDPAAACCLQKAGFVEDGRMTEFLHPEAPLVAP